MLSSDLAAVLNKTIQKIGNDIESMSFNTAVSSMMILLNEIEKSEVVQKKDYEVFLKILSPFAPHISEELWQQVGNTKSINLEAWPKADLSKIQEAGITIIIQINGKTSDTLKVSQGLSEEEIKNMVLTLSSIKNHMAGKEIKRVIYVKNRLLNIVI